MIYLFVYLTIGFAMILPFLMRRDKILQMQAEVCKRYDGVKPRSVILRMFSATLITWVAWPLFLSIAVMHKEESK